MRKSQQANFTEASKMPSDVIGAEITAAVGFVGVIITLVVNAQLQRRADARKFEFETIKDMENKKHQQRILRTALLGKHRKIPGRRFQITENQ
jgi:hypothetical protein